ncbi:Gfo/Idh/MocA family oxidoreductase [Natronolimnobius sp. AArcel1]|uniref:Gfo/Idh/MocA family protein n=1 Tax=Natronolimnobius sp. AArcel1 TaxID=1679093 RepID=UPI0013EAFE85|nr:Gfo/Idh/MocA family oxidoreductase [Natronolimnobius sp. AArcel1]NGM68499.1 Gfo/Idh/MocA family oxidoreductase [Natronolimnobius sp. AArcel1]
MDFGVLSTAGIAQGSFLPGIEPTEHNVTAIASRNAADAQAVADEHGIETVYEGYEDLLENAGVDAVYIPLPNALHAEWTKKAADAGIHVLCEKPLTVDAAEAREVVEYCADRDVVLMEAFMYQYHPRTERALELADEELEDIRSVTASFKFGLFDDLDNIRLSPDLSGGSLMDVGCYPLSFARQVLGEPDSAYAYTTDTKDSGVDTELAAILEYDEASARIACGFDTTHIQRYRIEANNGWIEADDGFNPGSGSVELEHKIDGRHAVETFDPVDQYRLEIEHFVECVETGSQPRTDGAEAIANMEVIDAIYESADSDRAVEIER